MVSLILLSSISGNMLLQNLANLSLLQSLMLNLQDQLILVLRITFAIMYIIVMFYIFTLYPSTCRFPTGCRWILDPRSHCRVLAGAGGKPQWGYFYQAFQRVQNRKEEKPNCKGNTISRESSHRSISFFKLRRARHKITMWITEHLLHVTQRRMRFVL